MSLDGKTILVTGGTGSFGQKFVRIALTEHSPTAIRIYSRDELKQVRMKAWFNDDRLRFLIGDVRDKLRLFRALNGVDLVVHAAALKQVPVAEYNPLEAVKTNIDGSSNVVDAAIDNGVHKVLALSTDKAAHPVNLYGATKLVAEKLFVQANAYAGPRTTRFSVVRYGNVVASRGSVLPLFQQQAKSGTLTITDPRMTRFWITQEQAVRFILKSIELMRGGEIFVPRIPTIQITDLAKVVAPEGRVSVTGIRPGEKLHEVLITEEEAPRTREHDEYFVIGPDQPFWPWKALDGGRPVPDGFKYTSDTNPRRLSSEELGRMIGNLQFKDDAEETFTANGE
jgi:UDP-N-acetylglucosamine 4,6-dehydratase (inverting)